MKLARSAAKPLTHTLDQHAANLGGRGQESNRDAPAATEPAPGCDFEESPLVTCLAIVDSRPTGGLFPALAGASSG